ncbi:iron ABC transporter permease [Paenibacillus athensensis]|nr:iron ABC transporter permease [Paenibacillus athensensis]
MPVSRVALESKRSCASSTTLATPDRAAACDGTAGPRLVYGIGSIAKSGLTPVRLVLAGAAVSALLTALSEGIALHYRIGQELAFWYVGGVAGTSWTQLKIMSPWTAAALLGALALSRSITMLSLGEEVARGLDLRSGRVKLAGAVIVFVLAGAAVSVVRAVGFIGLIGPHLAKRLVGPRHQALLLASALTGGLLLLVADTVGRVLLQPSEVPAGIVVAVIGAPYFLYLMTRSGR